MTAPRQPTPRFLKPFRFLAAWLLYAFGCFLAGQRQAKLAWPCLNLSLKAQGLYGFRRWPWSEDDLWGNVDPEGRP